MSRLTPGFIIVAAVFCAAFAPSCAIGQTEVSKELRTWIDNTGSFKIRAEFIEIRTDPKTNVEKVYLRRADVNKVIAVPLSRLSQPDLVFLGRADVEEPKVETPADNEPKNVPETTPTPDTGSGNRNTGEQPVRDRQPKPIVPDTPPENPTTNNPTTTKPPANTDDASIPKRGNDSTESPKKTSPAVVPFKRSEQPQPKKRDNIPKFNPRNKSPDSTSPPATNPESETMPANQPNAQPEPPVTQPAVQPPVQPEAQPTTTQPTTTQPTTTRPEADPMPDSEVPTTKPYREVPQPSPIAASLISVRPDSTARPWQAMSDEQLVQEIQLTGSLAWAGKVSISHNLEPTAPNFNLIISLRSAQFLDMIGHVGHVKIDSFIDDLETKYVPVVLPPRIPNPAAGWVVPRRGAGGRFSADGIRPVFADIEFPRPRVLPKSINIIKGSLQASLVEQSSIVSIQNVSENAGTVNHQTIVDKDITVVISRPDQETIVAEISGDVYQVMDVNLTGIGDGLFGETRMNISGKNYYQYNFVDSTPAGLGIDLVLIDKTRTLAIPFDFENIQFSANMR